MFPEQSFDQKKIFDKNRPLTKLEQLSIAHNHGWAWFFIIFIIVIVVFSVVAIGDLNKHQPPVIGDWPKGSDPIFWSVFSSQAECENSTGYICRYQNCDYIPPGKTFEEICGENFRKGWYASSQLIQKVCTMEAKICPDGSVVGRSGPNCDFAACPGGDNYATVKIGGQTRIQGVLIAPLEVVEDSRCPAEVLCVWAGTVKLRVKLEKDSYTQETVLDLGKPISFTGTEVLLNSVSPFAESEQTISSDQYIFSFIVTTDNADGATYKNDKYGFEVKLPESWQGFIITESQKDIYGINISGVVGHFPLIEIIHPLSKKDAPRQNIPIFVFTQDQWKHISNEQTATWSVSAAPFPPSELGQNSVYVFALPPRYNYAFLTGWEEVQQIVDSHPLTALELTTGAPSAPTIVSLTPNNGPVGTQVIINGDVWTSDARVIFSQEGVGEESLVLVINDMSNEPFFSIPSRISQYFTCPAEIVSQGAVCSQPPPVPVTPGIYKVKVTNNSGESNVVEFTVTPESGIR